MPAINKRQKYRIQDICSWVTSGGTPSRKIPEYYNGTIPWIKTGELKDWYLYDSEEKITDEAIKKSSAKVYPVDTVLIAMYGDGRTIGSLGITKVPAASNQACCAMKADEKKCNHLFLLYALQYHRRKIVNLALGGSQRNLNQGTIKNYEIDLPPLTTQRKIASILSAYDDLIENNTRRIKILEEMAQMIYREWFVKYRLPGHEKVRMVDSTMGKIPEGWEVGTFKDLVENRRESTKAGVHLSDRQYVPIECISKKSLTLQEAKPWDEAQSSLILFDKGDILFGAMRPYFHKVTIAPFNGVTRTTCFILRPLAPEYFAYVTLLAFQDETIGYATAHTKGATIPYAVWEGSLGNMMVLIPPCNLLEIFNSTVAPMLKTIQNAFPTLRNLRQTRDLLLPKLISGEVDVEWMEILTES